MRMCQVSHTNLMHTTKQYDLLSSLRKRLGVPNKSEVKEGNHELHSQNDPAQLAGDWNKSILVSKKKSKIGSLGKQNKTFKEWRVDPWERAQIVKQQER